jgi:hypothetical protein
MYIWNVDSVTWAQALLCGPLLLKQLILTPFRSTFEEMQ